jgi:hypothetical protein
METSCAIEMSDGYKRIGGGGGGQKAYWCVDGCLGLAICPTTTIQAVKKVCGVILGDINALFRLVRGI